MLMKIFLNKELEMQLQRSVGIFRMLIAWDVDNIISSLDPVERAFPMQMGH